MENKHKTAVSSISKYYDSLFIQYYIYNPYLYIFFQNIFKFWRNPLEVEHKYQM